MRNTQWEARETEVVKEGALLLQKNSEWRGCYLVVTASCLRCYDTVGNAARGRPYRLVVFDEDGEDVDEDGGESGPYTVDVLPDHARRSRNTKIFPFDVCRLGEQEGGGLLLATEEAPALWDWVTAIKWRGRPPTPEQPPHVVRTATRCSPGTCYHDSRSRTTHSGAPTGSHSLVLPCGRPRSLAVLRGSDRPRPALHRRQRPPGPVPWLSVGMSAISLGAPSVLAWS